ncbi:MAG: VOC family protein [Bradyrhizobium sp.]|nr:VOC family protein [Bradyrhizobium sp.]
MLDKMGCTFHHLGVACRNIEVEAKVWNAFGYVAEGPDFDDPVQRINGRFLIGPGPRLEILAPTTPDSPVEGILARGTKIYHQAFTVPRLDEAVAAARANRCKLMVGPVPAVAFEGRPIAFLLMPNMNLLEFIGEKI